MANFTIQTTGPLGLHSLPDEAHLAAIAAAEETIRQRKAIMAERNQPVATPAEVDAVLRGLEGRDAKRCPRCDSPSPALHPSMQFEGEVQPCSHPWHGGTNA